ncbi:Asp23/Gls24 family envelope stress response protein [Streptomyces flavofungini]|uniref:Asp23/Gls24 family envelope stress response protein n=1 Tax=Streptomyces flavofungini TaxID=68200 RepID=UPI0025B10751|nr:Asp23/Gls24 family envelope stress response protein [Streptomyces flavofungini]WJV45754.1 Asp23/Gls24 family envelope stress response protein [Streptomyces flavofungini]
MTEQQPPRTLADVVGTAVLATRGVAFLRPGLAELLRSSVGLGAGRGTSGTSGAAGASGVRVDRGKGSQGLDIEVYVVLSRGHRALDVTRAVRSAVVAALGDQGPEAASARVKVTVTGVV